MALYDAPVSQSYKVLTHNNAGRNYAKNGYGQISQPSVRNTTIPAQQISQNRVTKSAIYNRGISSGSLKYSGGGSYPQGLRYSGGGSYPQGLKYGGGGSFPQGLSRPGLREAGYGQAYPNPRGLATQMGVMVRKYKPGVAYSGAGSPRGSVLRDAYINDNPRPGTLRPFGLSGLADDTDTPVDSGTSYGPAAPTVDTSGGFLDTIGNAFSSIFTSTVSTAATAGQLAANNAVASAITGTPSTAQKAATAVATALKPTTILGFSLDTVLLAGAGIGAWYYFKK